MRVSTTRLVRRGEDGHAQADRLRHDDAQAISHMERFRLPAVVTIKQRPIGQRSVYIKDDEFDVLQLNFPCWSFHQP